MDINFACSICLIVISLSTVFVLILLYGSIAEAHVDRGSDIHVSPNEGVAVSKQTEDGDIMLGNSLSCLLIQIDVAKKYSKTSPEVALNALEEAESLAQQSLGHVRLRRRNLKMGKSTTAVSSVELSGAIL